MLPQVGAANSHCGELRGYGWWLTAIWKRAAWKWTINYIEEYPWGRRCHDFVDGICVGPCDRYTSYIERLAGGHSRTMSLCQRHRVRLLVRQGLRDHLLHGRDFGPIQQCVRCRRLCTLCHGMRANRGLCIDHIQRVWRRRHRRILFFQEICWPSYA